MSYEEDARSSSTKNPHSARAEWGVLYNGHHVLFSAFQALTLSTLLHKDLNDVSQSSTREERALSLDSMSSISCVNSLNNEKLPWLSALLSRPVTRELSRPRSGIHPVRFAYVGIIVTTQYLDRLFVNIQYKTSMGS